MNKEFWNNGFIILNNIFSIEEIENFKKEILEYTSKNKIIKNAGGITIPDFINKNGFENLKKN